jgi:hypothetical protein
VKNSIAVVFDLLASTHLFIQQKRQAATPASMFDF